MGCTLSSESSQLQEKPEPKCKLATTYWLYGPTNDPKQPPVDFPENFWTSFSKQDMFEIVLHPEVMDNVSDDDVLQILLHASRFQDHGLCACAISFYLINRTINRGYLPSAHWLDMARKLWVSHSSEIIQDHICNSDIPMDMRITLAHSLNQTAAPTIVALTKIKDLRHLPIGSRFSILMLIGDLQRKLNDVLRACSGFPEEDHFALFAADRANKANYAETYLRKAENLVLQHTRSVKDLAEVYVSLSRHYLPVKEYLEPTFKVNFIERFQMIEENGLNEEDKWMYKELEGACAILALDMLSA